MQITLANIGSAPRPQDAYESLVRDYLKRCVGVVRCAAEAFRTEAAFFEWIGRQKARTEPLVMLLDGHGRQMSPRRWRNGSASAAMKERNWLSLPSGRRMDGQRMRDPKPNAAACFSRWGQ